AKDVGSHEHVGYVGVGIQQKRVAGVIVEDDLVDAAEAHLAVDLLVVVDLAVGPVLGAGGQAVGGDLVHNVHGDDLEVGVEEIQALVSAQQFDFFETGGEVRDNGWGAHAAGTRSSRVFRNSCR